MRDGLRRWLHQTRASCTARFERQRRNARVLRTPTVRRLVGADFASRIGDTIVLAAMPFAVLSIGGDAADVGIVLAAQALGVGVFLPLGGVWGDRLDRLRLMVRSDLVRLCGQGVIAGLLLSGTATIWELLAAQFLHGAASAIFSPAAGAIVPDLVPQEALQAANSVKKICNGTAGVAGPAIGALGVAVAGPGTAMAADAATFLISALLLVGIAAPTREADPTGATGGLFGSWRDAFSQLREGWRGFRGRTWLWSVTVEFFVVNALVMSPFFVLGPVISDTSYSGSWGWAILLTVLAIGRTLGGFVGLSWEPRFPLAAGNKVFLAWAVAVLFLGLEAPYLLLAPSLLFGGIADSVFDLLWETTVQSNVPETELARVFSIEEFASLVSAPLGFGLAGVFGEAIGAGTVLIGASLLLVGAIGSVLAVRSVRELEASPSPSAAAADGSREAAPLA